VQKDKIILNTYFLIVGRQTGFGDFVQSPVGGLRVKPQPRYTYSIQSAADARSSSRKFIVCDVYLQVR